MKYKLSLLILTSFLFIACATTKKADDDKLKAKLIGSWSGTEEDNQKTGLTKHWIQQRNKNGTFVLLYTTMENCEVETHVEKGKWWIKEGVFYETFDEDGKTDAYSVEMLDDVNIKFKSKELSLRFDNKEYEFFENKIE